ncbi:MAG: hypothetical protein M3A44_03940 [Gammaproteobacteria bacterium]
MFMAPVLAICLAGYHGASLAAEKRDFVVTAAPKDGTHPFYGQGSKMGLVVDGVQGKTLVLTRGVEYTFNVNTGPMHDFYFSNNPVGQGASTITEGVTGQFTYRGTVEFAPAASTPGVVYYQCRNHKNMGGKIHVVDKGQAAPVESSSTVAPAPAETEGSSAPPPVTPSAMEAQVKQKIDFANMLVNVSKGAQRISASSNAQAKDMLGSARAHLDASRTALAAGDIGKAQAEVDESLKLVSAAARLVPSDSPEVTDPKFRYNELLDAIKTFESSYKQHRDRLAAKKGNAANTLDTKKFQDALVQARGHADVGHYDEANKVLMGAQRMVTSALGVLLNAETVVYDKNFATPAEEYEYELSRYKSYEELIPLAIEQRNPPAATVEKMRELSEKAKAMHGDAVQQAAKKDYATAIGNLQDATMQLQRALMIAGVN